MSHEADAALLERVAAAATRVADDLDGTPPRERDLIELKRRMFDVDVADGAAMSHFDECFVSGQQNPMGIAIAVRREGEEAVASVQLGPAFEGAPGRSHGGIVAAVFDDVLGYLLTLHKQPGFTGELHVRYRAATPIGQPFEVRARVTSWEGRKISVSGEATSDGTVIATATATFIAIDLSQLRP